jgi:hypothetical protein
VVNNDLRRATEALRLGREDEATVYAWNALMSIGPEDAGELRRIAVAIESANLQRAVDARWPEAVLATAVAAGQARNRPLRVALAMIVLVGGALLAWRVPVESEPLPATEAAFSETRAPTPTRITGDGIWLVPLGRVDTIDLDRLASDLRSAYFAWAGPVEVVPLPRSVQSTTEEQLSAEELVNLLNEHYIASDRTTVVGITDYEMRPYDGPPSFAMRAQMHFGVVSTAHLWATLGDRLRGHTRYERVRKLVKRQVEFHRNGGVQSSDPRSLLRSPLTRVGEIDQLDEDL